MKNKNLLLLLEKKLYQFSNNYAILLKEEQKRYYYLLQPVSFHSTKKLSFQKILLPFPEVKTFLPLIPEIKKKEYKPLVENFVPEISSSSEIIHIQTFLIHNEKIRLAYYIFKKKKKNFSFFTKLDSISSYFLNKFLKEPPKENTAICFASEILIIEKHFADIHYFPNLQKLPIEDFLQAIFEALSIKVKNIYFFSEKKKELSYTYFTNFFSPSFSDYFQNKNIKTYEINAIKIKKTKSILFKVYLFSLFISIFFLSYFILQQYQQIQENQKKLSILRTNIFNNQQNKQKKEKVFLSGWNYFRAKHAPTITNNFLNSLEIIESLESVPLENAWISLWQQDSQKIKTNLYSYNSNYWEDNQKIWLASLKKNVAILDKNKKKNIYSFSLEIKK